MSDNKLILSIFFIYCGAAILSTLVLYTKQSLLISYILLGIILGPSGLKLVPNSHIVKCIGDFGIIFLLFLLGLNLQPRSLWHMFNKTAVVAIFSSFIFFILGFSLGYFLNFKTTDNFILGSVSMFSSTIVGLKLLPTTILHHQKKGEIIVSTLLMQDIIAIFILLILHTNNIKIINYKNIIKEILILPILLSFVLILEKFILRKLFTRFDIIKEYIFLLAIAWCLSISELSNYLGLSFEIGAFIAGISIATTNISLYIAESLKPIRDFFLVMFFFSIGANFNLKYFSIVIFPALLFAFLLIILKPLTFFFLFNRIYKNKQLSLELSIRLGQISEFSLLITSLTLQTKMISNITANIIQASTIFTFIASSYLIVFLYETPMSLSTLYKD